MRLLKLTVLSVLVAGGSGAASAEAGNIHLAIVNKSDTNVRLQVRSYRGYSEKRIVPDDRGQSFYWTDAPQDADRDGTLRVLGADQDLDIEFRWVESSDRDDLGYETIFRSYRYYLRRNMRGYYLDGPYGAGVDSSLSEPGRSQPATGLSRPSPIRD